MAASGARSSWLTMPTNSARSRSCSSSGARSCMVTTTVSISPESNRIGVVLISMRRLRPSGTESSTSAARSVSALSSSSSVTSRPSGEPRGQHLAQVLQGAVRTEQAGEDAPGLPVDRQRIAGLRIEHHDADRRGLDQRLEVGPRAPLVAVRPRVGDGDRGLSREQHQQLLVLVGELLAALLPGEEEGAYIGATVAHRRALEGLGQDQLGGKAERADVARADRPGEAAPPGRGGARTGAALRATPRAGAPRRPESRRWTNSRGSPASPTVAMTP